jgi:hypothetical protein
VEVYAEPVSASFFCVGGSQIHLCCHVSSKSDLCKLLEIVAGFFSLMG